MANTQMKTEEYPIQKSRKSFTIAQILLRTMAGAAALAATLTMVTSKQEISMFGLQISAKYSYAPAFRFFVVANALACAYSVLSVPFCFLLNLSSKTRSHFLMFFTDMIMMGLLIAGSSAATAISYVGRNGNSHTGWAPICDKFERFCDRIAAALVCSFAAFFILFILSVLSANRLKQAPSF